MLVGQQVKSLRRGKRFSAAWSVCSAAAIQLHARRKVVVPRQSQGHDGVHAVDHRCRHQDRCPALLGGLVDDVHGTELQGCGLARIDRRRLDEFASERGFGRSEDDARLLFPLGLRLPRHRVLQGHRNRDVADLADFTEIPQSAVFRPISPRNSSSAVVRSDNSADNIDEPIISRNEVWATRSIASR